MDKKSRIITYVAIGVILIILIGIAIVTRISSEAPGLTAYSESGVTAQAIRGGYTWNSLLKSTTTDAPSPLDFDYDNENTLLVKPGEKVTFRNSGKDFDSYKFYQDEIKYYDKDNVETILTEEDAPINTESKSIVITAPEKDGTYIYSLSLNYHKNGNAQYGLKVVVSSIPSYQVESLLKYKNTYIGSAPTVGQLLNALPYSQYRDGMILRTSNKPYELIVYYKGLDVDKDSLFNNTVAIFALVDNVDVVTYELNDKSYVYTRKELETILGRDVLEYANDAELWKSEVFYNVKNTDNRDSLKIYRSVLKECISNLHEEYIVIDLDSFAKLDAFRLSDAEKRNLLKELMVSDKILSEAANAEVRQRDMFKGVLIYAENVSEADGEYTVEIVKYTSEKKQESVTYRVALDGTIVM